MASFYFVLYSLLMWLVVYYACFSIASYNLFMFRNQSISAAPIQTSLQNSTLVFSNAAPHMSTPVPTLHTHCIQKWTHQLFPEPTLFSLYIQHQQIAVKIIYTWNLESYQKASLLLSYSMNPSFSRILHPSYYLNPFPTFRFYCHNPSSGLSSSLTWNN